jgi:hypothetical protein
MMRWPSISFVFVATGRPLIVSGQAAKGMVPAYRNRVSSLAAALANYSTGLGDMHKGNVPEAPVSPALPPVQTDRPIPLPLIGGTHTDGRRPNRTLGPGACRYGKSFDCKQHLQTDDTVVAQ